MTLTPMAFAGGEGLDLLDGRLVVGLHPDLDGVVARLEPAPLTVVERVHQT